METDKTSTRSERSDEKVVYEGKIFEVIQKSVKIENQEKTFEIARRSPGVRLIIVKEEKILLAKEFRDEIKGLDYRLPGGKIFDTLKEYKDNLYEDILSFAVDAAREECREETGLKAKNIEYYMTARAGATVEWDLLYFIINDFEDHPSGQELEAGEDIQVEWKSVEEILKLIDDDFMKEDRTVGVLLKFLLNNKYLFK